MAERKPLVLIDGVPQQLPAGDTLLNVPSVSDQRAVPAGAMTLAIVTEMPLAPDPGTIYFVVDE